MGLFGCILLAVLSIWDYPSRQLAHERLRSQFVAAVRAKDYAAMAEACRKGTELLPDDPTWAYNLACAWAHGDDHERALDQLEKAIDLGFRDVDAIKYDRDLGLLADEDRWQELVDYAARLAGKPILSGPLATVTAEATTGGSVTLGAQNCRWNFDVGCFEARLELLPGVEGGNAGDLYMNRDAGHSSLKVSDFPGLTRVSLEADARARQIDCDLPNMLFPRPVFGNASRAYVSGPYWRSLPRAMMTTESRRMRAYERMYLSNQTWVFPANWDCPPVGTNGDVFASIAPYWLVTAGRSWSDQHYLRSALEASRSFAPEVKSEIVRRGLLAPTIQTLLRKSLHAVSNETDYLSFKAHPTCFPPNGIDLERLKRSAAAMLTNSIPPVAAMTILVKPPRTPVTRPEPTYVSRFAAAFVLRAPDEERSFVVTARGGDEYACVQTHGDRAAVRIDRVSHEAFRISLLRSAIPVGKRVDVAVFARNRLSSWGAPSYLSFATVDPDAPYSDPVLTPPKAAAAKGTEAR